MDRPPVRSRAPLLERPLVRAALAALVLAGLGLAAWLAVGMRGGEGEDGGTLIAVESAPTSSAVQSAEAGLGALDSERPIIGQTAPDFALRSTTGEIVRLSDLRGKVVFINFWATWCRPCKRELPDIEKVYAEKRGQGLEVLAVNWKDDAESAAGFLEDRGLTLPILLDSGGSVYDQYALRGLPDSFFVDRDGNIAAFQYGYLTEEKMRERLAQAGLE